MSLPPFSPTSFQFRRSHCIPKKSTPRLVRAVQAQAARMELDVDVGLCFKRSRQRVSGEELTPYPEEKPQYSHSWSSTSTNSGSPSFGVPQLSNPFNVGGARPRFDLQPEVFLEPRPRPLSRGFFSPRFNIGLRERQRRLSDAIRRTLAVGRTQDIPDAEFVTPRGPDDDPVPLRSSPRLQPSPLRPPPQNRSIFDTLPNNHGRHGAGDVNGAERSTLLMLRPFEERRRTSASSSSSALPGRTDSRLRGPDPPMQDISDEEFLAREWRPPRDVPSLGGGRLRPRPRTEIVPTTAQSHAGTSTLLTPAERTMSFSFVGARPADPPMQDISDEEFLVWEQRWRPPRDVPSPRRGPLRPPPRTGTTTVQSHGAPSSPRAPLLPQNRRSIFDNLPSNNGRDAGDANAGTSTLLTPAERRFLAMSRTMSFAGPRPTDPPMQDISDEDGEFLVWEQRWRPPKNNSDPGTNRAGKREGVAVEKGEDGDGSVAGEKKEKKTSLGSSPPRRGLPCAGQASCVVM